MNFVKYCDCLSRRSLRLRLHVKKEEICFVVVLFDQRCRTCGEKKFQSRPCNGLEQMPAAHPAIGEPYRAMRVDLGRTVDQADIANKRDQLHLPVDGDVAVCFARRIEPAESRALQRADSCEIARR